MFSPELENCITNKLIMLIICIRKVLSRTKPTTVLPLPHQLFLLSVSSIKRRNEIHCHVDIDHSQRTSIEEALIVFVLLVGFLLATGGRLNKAKTKYLI